MMKHIPFLKNVLPSLKYLKIQNIGIFPKYKKVLLYGVMRKVQTIFQNISPIVKSFTVVTLKPVMVANSGQSNDTENNIDTIIQMAEKSLEEGHVQDAETILLVALKLAETNNLQGAICRIYDILININYTLGDYTNAQVLIQQIINRLLKSGIKIDDDLIITFRLKLARLYGYTSHNDLAEKTFRDCLVNQKQKLEKRTYSDKSAILYVDLLFWYGIFLFQNEKFNEALNNIQAAYDYSNKINGINPAQELVLLTILSEIQCALGDYDQAIVHLNNAITIGKNINHPELSLSYVLLGNIYFKKEFFIEAKRWCEEGAKLANEQRNVRAQRASAACLDKIKQAFDKKYEQNQEHA